MTPYPPIERWRLPRAACEQTQRALLPAGRRGNESGVFWVGHRDATSTINAVIHPTGAGVIEAPDRWSVTPEVYAAVAAWAKPRGYALLAVVHSHIEPAPPRLSRTDRTQGLKVPHALAVIVGIGGRVAAVDAWGWFVYHDGDYREIDHRERATRLEFVDDTSEFVTITLTKAVEVGS
jgi:proteasome lid subunit RPN8/RPN11